LLIFVKSFNMKTSIISIALILGLYSCSEQKTTEQAETKTAAKVDTASFEHGYAEVNGLKMYYEVHGSGKPIVLIHGSFMTIPSNWNHIIPLFAKNRKVIVAEMQGHGRTADIERELSYEAMADDVSALLKHLKIDSADILGYSMGGGVAFQFAVRHPEQLRKLVILSGSYTHDGWWPEVEAMYPMMSAEMFKGTPMEKQYDSLSPHPEQFEAFIKKTISIDLKPYDWTADVKKIQAPIFMVIGDADGIRYEHALELFRAKGGGKMGDMGGMSDSRLAILPATTHMGMMERTDWLVPMVNEFLDATPQPVQAPPPSH
jgi:pimeloyl-ACP methyl ester carboxylesterase